MLHLFWNSVKYSLSTCITKSVIQFLLKGCFHQGYNIHELNKSFQSLIAYMWTNLRNPWQLTISFRNTLLTQYQLIFPPNLHFNKLPNVTNNCMIWHNISDFDKRSCEMWPYLRWTSILEVLKWLRISFRIKIYSDARLRLRQRDITAKWHNDYPGTWLDTSCSSEGYLTVFDVCSNEKQYALWCLHVWPWSKDLGFLGALLNINQCVLYVTSMITFIMLRCVHTFWQTRTLSLFKPLSTLKSRKFLKAVNLPNVSS